ncbi:MAG: hypothetical protein Q9221_001406 [Calogaya cf. arnoldii]
MLSCVLQSPSTPNVYSSATDRCGTEVGGTREAGAVSVSHPLAAIERYYPSFEAAFDANRPATTKPRFTLEMPKATSGSQSAGSSVGASTSDPMKPCLTGLTPPSSTQLNRIQHERSLSQIPLSTSPEQYKNAHLPSSNLASNFAASLVRPFSFSTPDSSSPPTAYSRNRLSPTASCQGAVTNSTWTQSGPRGKTNSKTTISKRQASSSPVRDRDGYPGRHHSSFETKLKNQGQFHNDGYAAEPLLDATKEERYSAYRSNYASMLLTWELPIASSKVLQYNAPAAGNWLFQRKWEDQAATDSLVAARRYGRSLTAQDTTELQLDFRDNCSSCNDVLPQSSLGTKCRECSAKHGPVVCQLCHCVVYGLSSPCLSCGHVLHLVCRTVIEQDEDSLLAAECVTGCGCKCTDHIYVAVQPPIMIEENTPVMSAINISEDGQEKFGWSDVVDDSENSCDKASGDIAYESLARNLGPRFLTPRPSQIWRSGEKRKASLSGFPKIKRSGSG